MGVKVREKDKDSGVWWVFINYKGKRTSRQIGTKKAAEKVKEHIEARLKLGQDALPNEEPPSPTLKHYYEKKLRPIWESSLSRNTFLSYDGSFRVHILPHLGGLVLTSISRDHVKAFVAALRKRTVRSGKKKEDALKEEPPVNELPPAEKPPKIEDPPAEDARLLSKETIRNIVAALRAGLSEAVESNFLAANPAVRLGKFYKEAPDYREEIDPFTPEDVSTLLKTTREYYGFENYVLLLALFHGGFRAGEAAGLY